jgi:hypothetical protein
MCGRYRLSRRKRIVEEHFDSVSGDEDWSPRYNIRTDPAGSHHPPGFPATIATPKLEA